MHRVQYDSHGGDTQLNHRTGEQGEIVRPLSDDEADLFDVGPMFRVRFDDGSEIDAFADELLCLHDGVEDASDCPMAALASWTPS